MRFEPASSTPLPIPPSDLPRQRSSYGETPYNNYRLRSQDPPTPKVLSGLFLSDTFSPSLTFTGFGPATKRSSSHMDPDKPYSTHSRPSKRSTNLLSSNTVQPSILRPRSSSLDALFGISIPNEPSFSPSISSDASDSSLESYLSSTPTNILSSLVPSTQSTITKEQTQKPSPYVSKSKASSRSSRSLIRSSSSKRPSASGSSSPRPLQFINKSGPPAPRPKPQLPMGVYVQTHSAMQQKARKKIREEGKVKRTSNCFIKYRTYVHPIIVAHFGPQNNKEISRLAGRWWKNEPEEVKSLYRQQAAEEKERHATLYPLYKYAPAKPAPKGDCSDSTKPKPQCPWNRPTRLSSPPAQLSSSPVLISPLPTPHDTEGKKQTEVHPVEGELTDDSSSSQAVAPDKSSTSAAYCPSLSKSSKERSFVVTETALFDFTGNANLNEKRCSPKSQSCSRPNRSHQRLSSMTDSLQRGISLASTTSTSGPIPSDPFAFVLQRPAVTSFPFLAGSKGVSGLTQALAQQRFDSTATPSTPTPIVLRAPASNTTSGWITMASRLQTSGISPQERWHVPQPLLQQACLATPVLTTLTAQPLNTVFQSNIGVSANDIRGIATDQNWAQSLPLSPQAPSPFLPHLATNLVQVPQISTPIQIPAPSVVTSQFSGPFSSPMYTPTLTPATARSSLGADSGFPWQLDANFGNPPDFGLLYSPPPHGSISCTPTALPSTPLMTMHIQQQGMISSSPMNIHPTLDSPHQALVASFEDELASVGLVHDMSSSQISDKMFDETTWNVKSPSCMPSTTTTAWEYPSLITNQCIVEFKQQLLLSDSGSNSSPLSKSPGPVYPEMDMSTWTTLGEPRVPSPICISDNNGTNNASDDSDDSDDTSNISSVNINDNTMDVDATSTSSSSNDAQVITLASQPATVQLTVSSDGQSSLAWDDEEQLKMSITYYEEIVQQQKMLLNLQRQWRLQAQVVQVSTASKTSPGMSLK